MMGLSNLNTELQTTRHWLLATICVALVLGGCAQDQDPPIDPEPPAEMPDAAAAAPERDKPAAEAEPAKPLDLSMPENFDFGDEGLREPPPGREFDAGALFKDEQKTLDVTVVPNVTVDEQAGSVPRLDGGSVTVEKKTR